MTGISDAKSNEESNDVYALKLELELNRAKQEQQFLQGLWMEKEASLGAIISEQRRVISILESVLKNNQSLLDAIQNSTQKKETELYAIIQEVEKSFSELESNVIELRRNLAQTELLLDKKEQELCESLDNSEKIRSELNATELKFQKTLADLGRSTRELDSMSIALADHVELQQTLEEKIQTLLENNEFLEQQINRSQDDFQIKTNVLNSNVEKLTKELTEERRQKNELARKLSLDAQNRFLDQINDLQFGLKVRDENIAKLSADLKKMSLIENQLALKTREIATERAINDKLKLDNSEFVSKQKVEFANLQKSSEELKNALEKKQIILQGLFAREERYKGIISGFEEKILKEKEKVRGTISYQLGYALLQAGKSVRGFVNFPKEVSRIRKIAKQRKLAAKKLRDGRDPKILNVVEGPTSVALKKFPTIGDSSRGSVKLKIAGVMDEFTYHSYAPEANILQLHPANWEKELTEFAPDILFIESAWQGIDGLWKTKISNAKEEIQGAIRWCKERQIPTLFWNKEDPVHFGTFLPIAGLVDYVFTTDIDCIPRYKRKLGHDKVYLLPFAAQPRTHNPIEKYVRKDAFNFAGSYYLRYPERQRDFASLIDTVKEFRPVEIYDRNFDNPHPHYTFPHKYKAYILGKLPFSEIDKAYKGYRFGINMNTIKQSQTMFARRVFEMLASNTVVVSNFSRGVRLFFGDLVVSSDNAEQLRAQVKKYCTDEATFRKFRLLGLRKVFSEHTYSHRLAYIQSKLAGQSYEYPQEPIYVVAMANNANDLKSILESFGRQTYTNKTLLLVLKDSFSPGKDIIGVNQKIFLNLSEFVEFLNEVNPATRLSVFSAADYYGDNFLLDLSLGNQYCDATVIGKSAYYSNKEGNLSLINDGSQYKKCDRLSARAAIFSRAALTNQFLEEFYESPENATLVQPNMVSIDEFNYCRDAGRSLDNIVARVSDLVVADGGVTYSTQLVAISENLQSMPDDIAIQDSISEPMLSAEALFKAMVKPASSAIKFSLQKGVFNIVSKLPEGKHAYTYTKNSFRRDEINLVLNSEFKLHCSGPLSVQTVFEFQDKDGEKIAHSMNKAGDAHALAIPEECVFVRFGMKLQGTGHVSIEKLIFGSKRERPFAVIGKSPNLIVSKQYPDYDDLYKYGFVHSRVRAYKAKNNVANIFRVATTSPQYYREFEGIDIATGDFSLLNHSLATGQFKNVFVHILDDKMWEVIQLHLEYTRVTVWVHGSEIQHWKRRAFEFENMNDAEIKRQKKLSDNRMKFWREILVKNNPNLHFVFVSQWLVDSTEEDLGIQIPKTSYSIINNFIDGSIFKYSLKDEDARLKVLSIRPYAKLVYANDLTVSAILELSKRSFFNDLQFTVVGDGELFEDTVNPLKKFSNVKLEKRFLTHSEIATYHAENGVFLVPTRMDTQGVSRDEAMSSGLVPITTAVAAIPEFVHDEIGIVVPPEDPIALADAVEFLYRNPKRYLQLSENAAVRTQGRLGFEQTINKELMLLSGAT